MIRKPTHFYRNARTGELMELFMVSAITSVLLTRFFLHVSNYPTLGGHTLHVAHMLWGGMLMTVAVVLLLAFIGIRIQRRASIIGGLGFGLFIDELGKFITRDNNYFFHPTIGLIYLIFVVLFIISRSLSQTRRLTQREYLLNAVAMTEEVVIHDLDEIERNQALAYLAQADQNHPLVPALARVLRQTDPGASSRSRWHRWTRGTQRVYERIIAHPKGAALFNSLFILNSMIFLTVTLVLLYQELREPLAIGSVVELVSATISPMLVLAAMLMYPRQRLQRYRLFSISLLVSLFVTQFFSFYHDQFSALPGFLINIIFYIGVRSLIKHEERLQLSQST